MTLKEKIAELYKNDDFLKKFNEKKTDEEVLALFKEFGVECNSIEDLKYEQSSVELSENELDAVAGGICSGAGVVGDKCICPGRHVTYENCSGPGLGVFTK